MHKSTDIISIIAMLIYNTKSILQYRQRIYFRCSAFMFTKHLLNLLLLRMFVVFPSQAYAEKWNSPGFSNSGVRIGSE